MGVVFAAVLLAVPGALAADPRDIARDLQDGTLDGTYTTEELQRFFNDATVQGYFPEAGVAGREIVRQQQPPPAAVAGVEAERRGFLPFTGVDLALMTAGGLALLGVGVAMRRFTREGA